MIERSRGADSRHEETPSWRVAKHPRSSTKYSVDSCHLRRLLFGIGPHSSWQPGLCLWLYKLSHRGITALGVADRTFIMFADDFIFPVHQHQVLGNTPSTPGIRFVVAFLVSHRHLHI